MSWISENYEKAALGAAAVAVVGLSFLGWQKLSSVGEDFSSVPIGGGPNDPAVKNAGLVSAAKSSFQLKREWTKGVDGDRPVDLFTGVALFVNKNDQKKPVDLIEGDPIHPPIPNSWWIENRIDPGFGDSQQRDADEDGFSNLEEFTANTDPNDANDYPPLITKLAYVGDEELEWVLRPGSEYEGKFTFEYKDRAGAKNKLGAAEPVAPGELFFAEGAAKGRFKLLSFEIREEMSEAIRAMVKVTIVKVEDQKPNKGKMVYEIPAGFREADARKFYKYDRTAVLTLDALGLSGEEFKVEENTAFALPPGAKRLAYKVTEVTPDFVGIEFADKDGKIQSYEISKGSTGPNAP